MFDVYWVDGWDEASQEPEGSSVLLAAKVETPQDCILQMTLRAGAAYLDYGRGEPVVIDREQTRLRGENVRVNPYVLSVLAAVG